ncbi:uncharacterized protein LOC117785789 [Drosophila innubila]|uniref:uncharacterized protein LOC117785789 n=1 Tax=Drosophila innubila TaxID=198719 RepID=UPI00148B4A2F|nr:uncharacterized protein LOC117785789 [Drosophila innubila]
MDVEMEKLEHELQEFLEDCRKQQFSSDEMRYICQPLIWHFRLATLKRWTLWFLLPILVTYLLWNYCDTCAWTMSAVGRLLLIQLLPYWNWTPYYYNKCLIERAEPVRTQMEEPQTLGRHETLWENCALCESLDTIATVTNVSFSMLESEYLERGLPVIVTDCGLELDLESQLQRILEKTPQLLASEPCDVSTNLLLRHLFNIDVALEKIRDSQESSASSLSSSWHLQFRNCETRSVKASRLYADKPYYYPNHLEPYYSSWLLMAHNSRRPLDEIYVRGLIFVQQLSGHFKLRLRPKKPCDENICPNLNLELAAGECVVFSTDLWRLSYGLQNPVSEQTSIATIFEVDWQR